MLLKSGTRKYIKMQNTLQRQILCMTFRSKTAIDKILKVIELNIHFHIIFINITLYKNREESPKENHFTTIYFMEKRLLITTDVLRCLSHNVASF